VSAKPPATVLEDPPRFSTVGFGLTVKFADVIVEPVVVVVVPPVGDMTGAVDVSELFVQLPPVMGVVLHDVPFVL